MVITIQTFKRTHCQTAANKRKDIAMLYVFNSANSVQIAWNGVLPSEKAGSKSRLRSLVNSLVRTSSAG
jgi:prophage maintenance system killer protein